MKTLVLSPALLILSTISSGLLHAQETKSQRTDTLRRELTVMTEETPQLGLRAPRDLSFDVLSPQVQPTRYTYLDTPIPFVLRPALAPLSALGDLRSGWIRPEQRGYAFLAGGLAFGAKAGAGVKLISTEKDHWDIYGRFRQLTTQPSKVYPLGYKQREGSWKLGSSYRHRFDAATLDLDLQGGQSSSNAYGAMLVEPVIAAAPTSLGLSPELRRRSSLFALSGRYTAQEDFAQEWLYDFGLKINYTQSKHEDVPGILRQKISEFLPSLSADLSYRLSSSLRVGAQADWSVGVLTASQAIIQGFDEARTSSTRMRLAASPYLLLDDASGDLSWRVLGGLRLALGNDHHKAHLLLFPHLDGTLRVGESFYVKAQADAQLRRHTLSSLQEESPYLAPLAFTGRYERIYEGKLTAGTTLGKALALEAFLGFEDHKDAALYRPQSAALPQAALMSAPYISPVSFAPDYYNYQAQRLGVEATYRHRGIFNLSARATFASYQTASAVQPLPTMTLQALAEFKPLEPLTVRAGYDFHNALQSFQPDGTTTRLKALHRFHADAVYRLTDRLHLTAELRTPLQTAATSWWGYAQTPLLLFGGLQFTF